MKKNLCFILAALLAWGGFTAQAGAQADGWYVAPKLGASLFTGDYNLNADHGTDYLGLSKGTSKASKNTLKPGLAGAIAIGYDFAENGAPVRTELEFTLRSPFRSEAGGTVTGVVAGNLDSSFKTNQKTSFQTLMANAFLDFETETTFTPYIGAGLGLAFISRSNTYTLTDDQFHYYGQNPLPPPAPGEIPLATSGNSRSATSKKNLTKFVWSLNAGGAFELTEGLLLDLGYRYFNFGDLTQGNYSHSGVVAGEVHLLSGTANDPAGQAKYKRAALHEVMLGLRFTYY